jgi:hypothetical protein
MESYVPRGAGERWTTVVPFRFNPIIRTELLEKLTEPLFFDIIFLLHTLKKIK